MRISNYFLWSIILVVAFMFSACQNENPVSTTLVDPNLKISSIEGDVPPGELTEDEIAGVIHMRLEEKLARDVYIMFGNLYNHQVFLNIQAAEQKHMDAMKKIIIRYELEDPVIVDDPGVFSDPDFQALYDQYILQGQISLAEAFLVSKTIEEVDITDLEYQLSFVDNQDVINVYTNLLAASQSHLAAFIKCIGSTVQVPNGI